jgi:hypothetical protein
MIYPAAFEARATILQSVRESCVDKSTADYCTPVKSGLQLDESELSRSARETYEYILSTSHVAISCASILGFLEPGQKTNLMTRYQEFQHHQHQPRLRQTPLRKLAAATEALQSGTAHLLQRQNQEGPWMEIVLLRRQAEYLPQTKFPYLERLARLADNDRR